MTTDTLLIEIGTEELPPKALNNLSLAFKESMEKELKEKKLAFSHIDTYATPRRLALVIHDLEAKQNDYTNERKGPALTAAIKEGQPTPALLGFARSCEVSVEQLDITESDKGAWYSFTQKISGESLDKLLPSMIEKSLKMLPIPKRMRWANNDFEFVRPVRWTIVLYGTKVIEIDLFGITSSNLTRGHRFHTSAPITIDHARNYALILEQDAYIIPDFDKRKALIRTQIAKATLNIGTAIVDEDLLNEVTALVEWPVALIGSFEEYFLAVPHEALIIAMKEHQRYFPMVNQNQQLLNQFCFISNIESQSPEAIISGNERVIRPRFSDAKFFWEEDKKVQLEDCLPALENVIFQAKLGSQADKIRRTATLAELIADHVNADKTSISRAARLNKSDLISNMVQEFPELQGIMARYYAKEQGETQEVADCLEQVYWPRFAGDKLPTTKEAQILGLAERLDTLVGIFSIGEIPTGSRDPFSLRRNALAILRIIIEAEHNINLHQLITESARLMPTEIEAEASIEGIFKYIFDRMKAYSADLGVPADTFESIAQLKLTNPLDIYQRLLAVNKFKKLPEAKALVESNKRIHNILQRNPHNNPTKVDPALFENEAEKVLFNRTVALTKKIETLSQQNHYYEILMTLANLAAPLEQFFETTMVMAEDERIRNNRLELLTVINNFFKKVADISQLQL